MDIQANNFTKTSEIAVSDADEPQPAAQTSFDLVLSSTRAIVVPNGTEVLPADVCRYIDQYRAFAKQSVEAILRLTMTLVEAERRLTAKEFNQFCREVGLEPRGSTHRKLRKIAENASRFWPIVEILPCNWTTLYKLAQMPLDRFEDLLSRGIVTTNMTGSSMAQKLSSRKDDELNYPVKSRGPDLEIYMQNCSSTSKAEIYGAIKALSERHRFDMTQSALFLEEIAAYHEDMA